MRILQTNKHGEPCMVIKSRSELTADELNAFTCAVNMTIDDYETIIVHRDKRGEIIRVVGHDFSEKKCKELEDREPNVLDICSYKWGKRKQRAIASEKIRNAGISLKSVDRLFEQK